MGKYIKGLSFNFGVRAFNRGLERDCELDKEFLDKFCNLSLYSELVVSKYREEWLKGWDYANISRFK